MTSPLELDVLDPYLDPPAAPGRGCLEQLAAMLIGFLGMLAIAVLAVYVLGLALELAAWARQ